MHGIPVNRARREMRKTLFAVVSVALGFSGVPLAADDEFGKVEFGTALLAIMAAAAKNNDNVDIKINQNIYNYLNRQRRHPEYVAYGPRHNQRQDRDNRVAQTRTRDCSRYVLDPKRFVDCSMGNHNQDQMNWNKRGCDEYRRDYRRHWSCTMANETGLRTRDGWYDDPRWHTRTKRYDPECLIVFTAEDGWKQGFQGMNCATDRRTGKLTLYEDRRFEYPVTKDYLDYIERNCKVGRSASTEMLDVGCMREFEFLEIRRPPQ